MFQTTNQFPLTNHQHISTITPTNPTNPTNPKLFQPSADGAAVPALFAVLPRLTMLTSNGKIGSIISLPRCDGFYLDFNLLRNFYDIDTLRLQRTSNRTWQKWIPWNLSQDSDILWSRSHILSYSYRKLRSSAQDDLWVPQEPWRHGDRCKACRNSSASPASWRRVHQQCPFGKNRGGPEAGIPSIIIETCR